MINKKDKNILRKKRHQRVRNKISGTELRPRLCVYRSNKEIYAQVIDDVNGITIANASTMEKDIAPKVQDMNKTDASAVVGEAIAKRAMAKDIENVVFDRSGYLYTGRVQSLADGARKAGLKF